MTSIAIVIPFMVDGVKKYFVHTHSFIPSSRVDEHIKTDKVPYDVWIEKGLVTVTETLGGIKTDYKYIIKYLEDCNGVKWLYVVYKNIVGYASSKYLSK